MSDRKQMDCLLIFYTQVHRGSPTPECLECLSKWVIEVSIVDKYMELSKDGSSPICLFPTRKACKDFDHRMLSALDSELHKVVCIDEIDETSS